MRHAPDGNFKLLVNGLHNKGPVYLMLLMIQSEFLGSIAWYYGDTLTVYQTTKLKTSADDKIKVTQKFRVIFDRVENSAGKRLYRFSVDF